jgi:hypothetical protein
VSLAYLPSPDMRVQPASSGWPMFVVIVVIAMFFLFVKLRENSLR